MTLKPLRKDDTEAAKKGFGDLKWLQGSVFLSDCKDEKLKQKI